MPVDWSNFEVADEPKSSTNWDEFEPVESERPPEREPADFTPPSLEPEIPRPSVGATGYWGAGATGTWEDESGIPPEIGTEQTRRIRAGVDLLAARLQGDKEQREAESLGEQYRSIERFTPAGILNQPERIARAIAAPDAPEVPERFQPGQPIFPIPEPQGTNAMAGLGQLGVQTLNALQTPEMIVTAPAAANPVGRALFAADMGRHIPEQVEQGAQVIGDIETTPAQKVVAGGTPVIAGTMTALLGKSEIPRPAIVERTIAKTEAAVPGALSKSVEALKKVEKPADKTSVETKQPEVTSAIQEPPATEGVLRQERSEVGLPEVRGPQTEAAIPREPARGQGGEERQVLLTPPKEPVKGERFVTLEKPDGTTEQVSFGDKFWEMDDQKIPSVAHWTEGGWSHGMLREGERIVEPPKPLPPGAEEWRVKVAAPQDAGGGETMPGFVQIIDKAQTETSKSPTVESLRAAGHDIPDLQSLPQGDYSLKEAIEKARVTTPTEATTPTTANQTAIPARQAHVVEPGVGAVPENVSGAEPPTPGAGRVEPAAVAPESGTYAAGAKVLADKLREQFKTETQGGQLFTGPVKIINGAVEIAAKIIEYGGSAADALAAGLKYIRENSPGDEAAFRSKFNEALKTPEPTQRMPAIARVEPVLESTPLDPASGVPIVPPVKPPGKPPAKSAAATPAPEPAKATLDDVYKIFEPAPKEGKGISQRVGDVVESFRTGFSSKFRPLNKLAEDIAAKVGGKAKDIAGIFEQLKGSSGKAEADVYRFDKDVSDLVKGSEKDFNAYVFLRRSLDRLQQDAADITSAQAGENVPKLNRRRVSQYTIPQLESKLTALSEQIGGEKLAQFNKAAEGFQTHMDQALRLQVESGRMSPEVYDAIKAGNQFYAPFKVMKYIEETVKPEGSGRKVDTVADFTKAMEGIDDPDVKLGDMLAAARQNLTLSRTLAEKNRAMQNITELAALDVDGTFVQKLKPGAEAPAGMEAVNVLENGVSERYAVNSDVAQAVANAGPGLPAGIVARWSSGLFRAGATTLNAAFQPVNLLFADAPRASLVSKYGVKGVTDLVRYPMDFVESLFSSISADVFGVKNKLFQDFLDSGAAGTTVQQYLTPEALRFKPETAASKSQAISGTILNTIPQFANAIEQTSKVLGVKRAMRIEGAESGAALARQIPEAITEIRRFSGSPDFGRSGKWVEQYRLNLVYMFLNARIQGAVADVGRLTGRDGASRAAKTWLKMGTAVGIPTAYLYMLNNSDEYKADYAKRPEQEKQNYWLIPKDTFITGSNGEKIRDYWRVPKREIAQWMGNAVESGLDFANERDPDAFWKWAGGMAESIAPVNIRGNTLQERGESVLSGTHPFIKAPIETFSGRDTYRHRPIVPDSQKKASPEQQYDERTPDVFKTLADKMPDVAPEVFRSPKMLENLTKNFTAGLLTQFLPRQPVEGRSKAENLPLTQRFQALPYTDSSEFDQRIQKFERESADEQLKRMRDAKDITDSNKGAKPDVLIKQMIEKHGRDPKMAERIVDLYVAEQRGITPQERRILALPVTQRAEYLADELNGKTPEQKAALLRNWAMKRILTERVGAELAPRITP